MSQAQDIQKLSNLLAKNDYKKLLKESEKFISKYPNLFEGYNFLSLSNRLLGNNSEAEKILTNIIENNQNVPEFIYHSLGHLYIHLSRFKEAHQQVKNAININPKYGEAYHSLGFILQELGYFGESLMAYNMSYDMTKDKNSVLAMADIYRKISSYPEAIKYYEKVSGPRSDMNILEAHYYLGNSKIFNDKLLSQNVKRPLLPLIACLSAHSAIRYTQKDNYPYCPDPMDYISVYQITEKDGFTDKLIKDILSLLEKNKVDFKAQSLLHNGTQSAGDIFAMSDPSVDKIKKIIEKKIIEYRKFHQNENIGLFNEWPKDNECNLKGWIIKLKKGGQLSPHIHKEGWVSGSLYFKIPKKNKTNEGDIKFSLNGANYPTDGKFYFEKIVPLQDGTMVLFPSSVFHSTIPFESNEDRITFAFDIIPNHMYHHE